MHTLQTLFLVCKVCTLFQTLSGKSSKTPSNPTHRHTGTQLSVYVLYKRNIYMAYQNILVGISKYFSHVYWSAAFALGLAWQNVPKFRPHAHYMQTICILFTSTHSMRHIHGCASAHRDWHNLQRCHSAHWHRCLFHVRVRDSLPAAPSFNLRFSFQVAILFWSTYSLQSFEDWPASTPISVHAASREGRRACGPGRGQTARDLNFLTPVPDALQDIHFL